MTAVETAVAEAPHPRKAAEGVAEAVVEGTVEEVEGAAATGAGAAEVEGVATGATEEAAGVRGTAEATAGELPAVAAAWTRV